MARSKQKLQKPESHNAPVIFIVDAEQETYAELGVLLRDFEYRVKRFRSGGEVFKACELTGCPDIVILSDKLPDLDSFEACRRLLSMPDSAKLPVIMMLSDYQDEFVELALQAGAADCLPKEVHRALVGKRVQQLLQLSAVHSDMKMGELNQTVSKLVADYTYIAHMTEDCNVVIDWAGDGLCALSGYSLEEINKGNGWYGIVHSDDKQFVTKWHKKLCVGEGGASEFRIFTKSGEVRWVRDYAYLTTEDDAVGKGWIYGAVRNITERKETEEMFRQQQAELQARNEELDAFTYTVAHDLKNPVASMLGFASLVQRYYARMDDDTVLEYVDLIIESAYIIKDIINGLLLLAGAGQMTKVEMTELDMPTIVENAQKRLSEMIDKSNARITIPESWPAAAGHDLWVEEIWTNYLSNALKYGGTPPIVSLGAESLPNGDVRFWVQDNGTGLSVDEQKIIFAPFTRLQPERAEGHGLGLAIVQRIVGKLGGNVSVQNAADEGNVFYFTLPGL
jgi:PAS domain S-box-containing protein